MPKSFALKTGLALGLALAPAALASPAEAATWGKITFSPKEAFWDEEYQEYLLDDSYELSVSNPDTFGLKKSLLFACALDEFGDDPTALRFDITILFEGTAATSLPVTAEPEEWTFQGNIHPVTIATPAGSVNENWSWFKYEADYVSGTPADFGNSGFSYQAFKAADWVRVETLGHSFTLDMALVKGYLQAFERKCGEL